MYIPLILFIFIRCKTLFLFKSLTTNNQTQKIQQGNEKSSNNLNDNYLINNLLSKFYYNFKSNTFS